MNGFVGIFYKLQAQEQSQAILRTVLAEPFKATIATSCCAMDFLQAGAGDIHISNSNALVRLLAHSILTDLR